MAKKCPQCGKERPKFSSRFCDDKCESAFNSMETFVPNPNSTPADNLRAKMVRRGEPVMTEAELNEYRSLDDCGDRIVFFDNWKRKHGLIKEYNPDDRQAVMDKFMDSFEKKATK